MNTLTSACALIAAWVITTIGAVISVVIVLCIAVVAVPVGGVVLWVLVNKEIYSLFSQSLNELER